MNSRFWITEIRGSAIRNSRREMLFIVAAIACLVGCVSPDRERVEGIQHAHQTGGQGTRRCGVQAAAKDLACVPRLWLAHRHPSGERHGEGSQSETGGGDRSGPTGIR